VAWRSVFVAILVVERGDATVVVGNGLRSQLAAELDASRGPGKIGCSHVLLADCELCSTVKYVPRLSEPTEDALIES
jgi:hypothetical protein